MIKKAMAILIYPVICLMMTGCQSYREVEHLAIVAGCAVDKSTESKVYHLTAEVYDTSGGSNSPTKAKLLESDGYSIFDANRNFIKTSPKKLYWSNCQIVIINEEIAKAGIKPVLDYYIRDHEPRPTILVLISQENTAREIILPKSKPTIISADLFTSISISKKFQSTTNDLQLFQIINILDGEGGTALTLPAIRNISIDNMETSEVNGVAVFDKDKLIGYLKPEDTKYFLFTANKIKGGVLTTNIDPGPSGAISCDIIANDTKTTIIGQNNELIFQIKTKTTVSLLEQGIGQLTEESDFMERAKICLQNLLEENISRVVKMMQDEYGQDIFGFGTMLSKKKPALWQILQPNWNDTFKHLKVEVTSEVTIRDNGAMGNQ
ncbi:MAG: Ger(x)C family spore germination protein [Clostridiaceae bacterium]|nr:Ger(x)C family spore germination protein [Clostridiaceae bacterium]